jgi:hypothetical protein
MSDMPGRRCHSCGATVAFGRAHEMRINDKPTFWCIECAEAWWPEDWGPHQGMNIAKASKAAN